MHACYVRARVMCERYRCMVVYVCTPCIDVMCVCVYVVGTVVVDDV